MTVTSVLSVSLQPPTMLISVRRDARTTQALRRSGKFAVSLLQAVQEDVAVAFSSGSDVEREAVIGDFRGIPVVRDSLSYCFCRVTKVIDVEDHALVIAAVTWTHATDARPLIRARGEYLPAPFPEAVR